jgi:hypothetical protein
VTSSNKLACELCRRPVGDEPSVAAIEVLTERDRSGRIVHAVDGYNVVFHEACWRDLQSRRTYSARSFRRPRSRR